MKKWFALALAALLAMTALCGASAEQTEIPDDPSPVASAEPEEKLQDGTARALTRSDTVEIDGNQYAVVTGESIGIAYEVEESGVYVLTQDYLRQSELYADFYDDPLSAVSEFVKNGMHMNIYDAENDVDLYIYVCTADWATLYPDTDKLDADSRTRLKAYFKRNGFGNAGQSEFGYAGGNQYFFYDCSSDEGRVYLLTSVGGYMIQVQYKAKTEEQVMRGLELMRNLTIAAM